MKTIKITAPGPVESGHFFDVRYEMGLRGAPKIRAWKVSDGVFIAIEGSHRLAVADALGITPVIEEVKWIDIVEHDFAELESPAKVGMIISHIGDAGPAYSFEIKGEKS